MLNAERCWAAVIAHDATQDGRFFYSVKTTGVYCRPSCGSRPARPENVAFYKELYAYKPVEATLPPGGQGGFTLPPNHPAIDGSPTTPMFPSPLMLPPPPPSSTPGPAPAPNAEKPEDKPAPGLPPEVFTPERPAPQDKDKDKTRAEPLKGDLPGDPFAPKP